MSLKMERDINPTARNQVTRAKTAIQARNIDYAITLLQATLKEEPLFLEGRKLLRRLEIDKYRSTGSFARQMASMRLTGSMMKITPGKKPPQELLVQAEEVLVHDPFNSKANATIGEAGTALGYPEFKCFAYETIASGKPENDKSLSPILHTLAQAYMENHDPGNAEKTYEKILRINPADGDALSGLKNASAANASKVGKWDEAKDYRDVLKDKAESNQLEQEAKVVKSTDAIADQIAVNYAKHEADPSNPNHGKAIAQLLLQKNDLEGAIGWYQYAYEVGNKTDSSLEKIVGDLRLKKVETELQSLQADLLTQADPEMRSQAEVAVEQKEKELNEVRLFQAEARVKAQPNEGEFRYDLGEALFKVGQYKRAVEELQHSLKQPSVRHQALNLMGQAFTKRGMYDFAIKQLSLAESELPAMDELKKEITYNLGLVYELTKASDKALDQWKKIYEVDMGYRDVSSRVEASYGGEEAA